MARIESDREDLLQEAVALIRRIEFTRTDFAPAIIAGFRPTGRFSVYFGPDHMLQFDAAGQLRRAFVEGLLYRTQGNTLARLRRQRTEVATVLMRHDLDEEALNEFREVTLSKIAWFHDLLAEGQFVVNRKIPANDDSLVFDILQFLESVSKSTQFLAPAIRAKP